MKIKVLKLVNGNEVICSIVDDVLVLPTTPTNFLIKKPVGIQIVSDPRNPNQQMVSFVPFMFSSKEDCFDILSTNCITISNPTEEIEKAYLQATTTIQLMS
jgi:hypothetical protein